MSEINFQKQSFIAKNIVTNLVTNSLQVYEWIGCTKINFENFHVDYYNMYMSSIIAYKRLNYSKINLKFRNFSTHFFSSCW